MKKVIPCYWDEVYPSDFFQNKKEMTCEEFYAAVREVIEQKVQPSTIPAKIVWNEGDYQYDIPSVIRITGYREETDTEYKKRLEKEERAKQRAKDTRNKNAQKKALKQQETEKRERELLAALKKKYE